LVELLEMLRVSRGFRVWTSIVFSLAVILSFIAFWAVDNTHPNLYDEERSYISPPIVSPGDQVRVVWALKTKPWRHCEGTIRRVLSDPETKAVLASYDVDKAAPPDLYASGWLIKSFAIPKTMPKGRTAYRADACYACNPLQRLFISMRICYSTPTLYFTVE
jgi:hypothetical protein